MAKRSKAKTIGELKASGYKPVSLREEMRRNLLAMIKERKKIFPGIIGFDDTVIPQIENAIISGQDIIFLGERGQAKSRIMRALINLLDEEIPVIKGCESMITLLPRYVSSAEISYLNRGMPRRLPGCRDRSDIVRNWLHRISLLLI